MASYDQISYDSAFAAQQHYQNTQPAADPGAELAASRVEIAQLKAENATLKAELATLRASSAAAAAPGAALVPPPAFYAPPNPYSSVAPFAPSYPSAPIPPYYGTSYGYGAPPPPPDARPSNPPLAINAENRRGPKGANLALFCIPNAYTDQQACARTCRKPFLGLYGRDFRAMPVTVLVQTLCQVYDLAKPYGNVIFAQVATHRDTGLSRGYAFVSYETVDEANCAIGALHNFNIAVRTNAPARLLRVHI